MIRKIILLAFFSLFLNSCVGVVIMHTKDLRIDNPQLNEHKEIYSDPSRNPVSKTEIENAWGKPDQITRINDHEEKWLYNSQRHHSIGIIFVPLFPIPIPSSKELATLVFVDNSLIRAEGTTAGYWNFVLGFIVTPKFQFCSFGDNSPEEIPPPLQKKNEPTPSPQN